MKFLLRNTLHITCLACLVCLGGCQDSLTPKSLSGTWAFDQSRSTDLDQWRTINLTIAASEDSFFVRREFGAGRYGRADELHVATNGQEHSVPLDDSSKWLENVHLGVFTRSDDAQAVVATWSDDRTLVVRSQYPLQTSTGVASVTVEKTYSLVDANTLTIRETRSSRDEPLEFTFERVEEE